MEHVRVGDHDLTGLADGRPDGSRCITVVAGGRNLELGITDELGELGHLILPERLGGEQEQRPR